jgi:dihydrofolate synthase/folylpolyglutamate synthase
LDYAAALDWLAEHYNLEITGATRATAPTLDRMRALVELLGDPQTQVPMVHVTGTNGKGSTVRMISALLTAHGLRTGGYTSPTLERVNERITDDNQPLGDDAFAEAVSAVAAVEPLVVDRLGERLSYFELTAAAAYEFFATAPCSAAVVEVGLGGRFDATNVGDGAVAVVTNIGSDHLEWIGPTRRDVAVEKAGIVKPGSHLVLGETDPDLVPVFLAEPAATVWRRRADFDCERSEVAVGGRALTLRTPGRRYEDLFLPLHGRHQGDNAAIAVAAAEAFFGRPLDPDVLATAFAELEVPGRFEVMRRHPLVVIDGAHNPEGAEAAATTLYDDFASEDPPVLVVGMNRPRHPEQMLEALRADEARHVIATAADWPKAVPPGEIAAAGAAAGTVVETVDTVAAAVDRAIEVAGADGTVLVAGSLYVVGEARAHLRVSRR